MNGNNWSTLSTLGAVLTTDATGLAAHSTHKYRVIAVVNGKNSPVSNVVTATTFLPPVTGVQAVDYSTTRIDVSWIPVTGASTYKIQRSTDNSKWTVLTISPALTGTSNSYSDTTVSAGTAYYYQVIAVETQGNSQPSSSAMAMTLPAQPVLTATVKSSTEIDLTWSTVTGATSYLLEDSLNGGVTWSSVVTQSSTTYNHTSLTPNTAYQYRLTAIDSTGKSQASATQSATTPLAAPTGLTATDLTTTSISLAWNPVIGATGFKLERSLDNTMWTTLMPNPALTGSAFNYVDASAAAGTKYYYRVSAINSNGTSSASTVENATTLPGVSTLTATVASATSVMLSWTTVTGATSYLLQRSADGGNTWTTATTTANTTYTDTSLTADTAYKYQVTASDGTGAGAASSAANVTTLLAAPTGLTATPVSATEIDLTWNASTDATTYKLERSPDNMAWTTLMPNPALTGTSVSYHDTSVSAGTQYYYRLSAIDSAGTSTASTVVNATTIPAVPAPTAAAASATSITLTWTAMHGATTYTIQQSSDGGNTWVSLVPSPALTGASTTYTVTGLTADTSYQYQMKATDGTGSSAYCTPVTQKTDLAAPSGAAATANSATSITVSWTPENDATGYKIERSLDQMTWTTLMPSPALTGSSLSYTDTTVLAGTTYYYRVSGISAAGTSAASTVVHALTYPGTTTVTLAVASSTSVMISWTAVQSATSFTIQQSADGGLTWTTLNPNPALTGSSTSYTQTGLSADTLYKYKVSASNATGAGAYTSAQSITTLLSSPTGLTATAVNATQIQLAWTSEFDATNYKLEQSTDNMAWTTITPNPALNGSSNSYTVTGLNSGTTYYYRISAIDAAGTSASATAQHAETYAAAPTLTLTSQSASAINVSWTSATSATSYVLQDSTDGGTTWNTVVSPSTTSYAATGLTADTTYKYRVAAVNPTGTGAYSATATAATYLAAPQGLAATVVSSTEITLSWTAETDATNYKLEQSTNNMTWTTITPSPALTGSSTSYNVTGLTAGTQYYFRISGINSVGTSVAASAVNATTLSGAPVLTIGAFTASQIAMSWTAGNNATSYTVEESTDGGNTYTTLASTTNLTYTAVGLTPNDTYKFKIVAVNPGGASLASNVGSQTTLPATPAGFSATASSSVDTEIDLAWTAVGYATGYKIERSIDNVNWTTLMPNPALAGSATSYADTSVSAGSSYYYRISAIDAIGTSTPSPVSQAQSIPAAPTLTSTNGQGQISLSWNAQVGATSYVIKSSTNNMNFNTLATVSTTSYVNTGLMDDTNEWYEVTANDATGPSVESNVAAATTLLPVTTSVSATASTSAADEIDLAWTAVSQAVSYKIERSTDQINWTVLIPNPALNGMADSYDDLTAATGTTSYYKIFTEGVEGTSNASSVVSALTIPAVPTVTATPISATQINLTWPAITGAASYVVQQSADNGSTWTPTATPTTNSYNVTSLTADTPYEYQVKAVNGTGASAYSSAASATTWLGAVTGFTVTASSSTGTEIDLAWTAVTDATTYVIQRSTNNQVWTTLSPNPALTQSSDSYADTSVSAGTTYYYTIAAHNSLGTGVATSSTSALSIPAVPTISATTLSATSVSLSWNPVKGATTYDVQQSVDGMSLNWTTISAAQSGTTYTATGLTADTKYDFHVRATDATGSSAYSTMAQTTTVLGAVTGFSATASSSSSTEIDLAWTAVTDATTYVIKRSLDGNIWTTLTPNPALTQSSDSYADMSVSAGTKYYYTIAATNSNGTSVATSAQNATTIPATPTLTATPASATSITLNWNSVVGATVYNVESYASMQWTSVAMPTTNTYTVTGLTADTQYTFRVTASDGTGPGGHSNSVMPTTILGAVAGFTVTPSTSSGTEIDLAWTASTDATTYVIQRSLNNTVWTTLSPNPALTQSSDSYADMSVSAGTQYYYRIAATNANGQSAWSTGNGTSIPAVPTVTATNLTSTSVMLQWAPIAGAVSYDVQQATDGMSLNWSTISAAQSGFTYTATGLTADTKYDFQVRATNATGHSAYSTMAQTTTILGAVTGFMATASSSSATTINLAWTAVTDATTYKIERSINNAAWTTLNPNPALTQSSDSYADAAVSGGTEYYYRISAVNSNGTSAATSVVNATTIPAAPTLTAIATSATAVNLTWNPVYGATSYLLEDSTDNTNWNTVMSTGTSATATGLTADTEYYFRVTASDGTGAGPHSTVQNLTTPLGAVTGFTATASTSSATTVNLAWTAVTDATGYVIMRSTNQQLWTAITPNPALTSMSTSYADTTAVGGTTYYYTIAATNANGTSAAVTSTAALTVPAAPTVTVTPDSSTSLDLTWTPVASAVSYDIQRSTDDTNWTTVTNVATTLYTDTGLTADSEYYYQVRANNATGHGAYSAAANATTLLNAPSGFTATVASDTSVTLGWTAVADATTYVIERSDDSGASWNTLVPSPALTQSSNSYTDTTVSAGTLYQYRISAQNANGVSLTSTVATVTTTLAAPTGLTATAASATQINLTWTTDMDAGLTEFKLYSSATGMNGSWSLMAILPSNANSYFDISPTASTTRYYQLVAINAGGASAPSTSAMATTPSM